MRADVRAAVIGRGIEVLDARLSDTHYQVEIPRLHPASRARHALAPKLRHQRSQGASCE